VHEGWYNLEIIAAGYERAKERIELTGLGANSFTVALKPAGGMDKRVGILGAPILAPKAKKELGKAQEALHARQLSAARSHLDAVYRLAPGNPDVNYVFAIYWMETNELERAKDYLEKVLNLDPKHTGALRALGIVFLWENMPTTAVPYLKRAIDAEPTSWRSHALLAEVCLRLGLVDESVSQAERALVLGHGPAAIVQPLLARALAKRGETDRAIQILQKYLQEHASDTTAAKQLEDLKAASQPKAAAEARAEPLEALPASTTASPTVNPFLLSSWLPPDTYEITPPVEPSAPRAR
jgi:predicted Zn-dependent protease